MRFPLLQLLQRLRQAPARFDFFQALRLLEARQKGRRPGQPAWRFGTTPRPSREPVRLGQDAHQGFEPAMLASWEARGESPPRLGLTFFGLFGPQGPMPLHLTAHLRDRVAQGDTSFRDFADLLQHRVIGLYYRAWAGSRPGLSGDVGGADRFTFYLRALAGVALPGLEGRDALPDGVKIRHAWLLGSRTHHPDRLRHLLEAALGVRIAVTELQPAWLDIPVHAQTRLGEQHAELGTAVVAGSRVLDVQHRFRLRIGPMPRATYLALLPGGTAHRTLVAAVRGLVGDALAWDAVLVLAGAEIPPLRLDGGSALGWTSWLGRSPARGDADDLALEPQLAAA